MALQLTHLLWGIQDVLVLLTKVLAVPVNVQNLLVELLRLLLFFFRGALKTVLDLMNFELDLLALHHQSEKFLNSLLLFFREITVQNLFEKTLIYILRLYFVSNVKLMQYLLSLLLNLLVDLKECLKFLQLLVLALVRHLLQQWINRLRVVQNLCQLLTVNLLLLLEDHHVAQILVLGSHLTIRLSNHVIFTVFEFQDSKEFSEVCFLEFVIAAIFFTASGGFLFPFSVS